MKKTNFHKYSTNSKKIWLKTEPVFTEKTLYIKNYQVMQRWETNYMRSLAAVTTSRGGDVLEVGFGMGISTNFIQMSKKIRSHTIIECHQKIIDKAKQIYSKEIKVEKIKFLKGFWEDITPKIKDNTYDAILFDTAPLDSGVELFQFFPFFPEAYRLLKKGGIFTYFSDEAKSFSKEHMSALTEAGFKKKNINYKLCKVHPPKYCEYWKHNTILVPMVSK